MVNWTTVYLTEIRISRRLLTTREEGGEGERMEQIFFHFLSYVVIINTGKFIS